MKKTRSRKRKRKLGRTRKPKGSGGFWGRTELERERLKTEFEEVSLDELQPWEDNPRFNQKAVKPLAQLIEKHGFAGVIVATPDGTIWSGNTRYLALRELGWDKVWVHWRNFDSETDAANFALADNKAGEWAEWDHAKLAEHFKKQTKVDMELLEKVTGFQKQEIEWQGDAPINLDEVDDFEVPVQEYSIRIDGVTEHDKDKVLDLLKEALQGSGYVAKAY